MFKNFDGDYLNKGRKRNEKNTDRYDYNCGGYSLGTFNWYRPYHGNPCHEEVVVKYGKLGLSQQQVYNVILRRDVENMLKDFPSMRVVNKDYSLQKGERLIAYRIYATDYYGSWEDFDDPDDIDCDFHFRFRNYGEKYWREKCGAGPCHLVEVDDEDDWGDYDSQIIYLSIKI